MSARPSRAARVLEHRLDTLLEHVEGARAGHVEDVHQARVASRRLREALPVVGAACPRRVLRRARRRVRRLTRALGPVREMDVALGVLSEDAAAAGEHAAAARLVQGRVDAERARRRAVLLGALAPAEIAATAEAVREVAHRLPPGPAAWRAALARRTAVRAAALRERVVAAGLLYGSGALHAVRIAAKQLRYALELSRDLGAARHVRALTTLKDAQEALGRLHDLDVLAGFTAGTDDGNGRAAGESALVNHLQAEARRLHADYLEGRHRLLAVADAAAAPRAGTARRPTARRASGQGGTRRPAARLGAAVPPAAAADRPRR
jgi:CHAD domain-containing protein